jgi:hypothetical protein
MEVNENNLTDALIEYECNDADEETILNLFSYLIKSKMAWSLQGSYGRMAKRLIDGGYIDKDGNITKTA